MKMKHSQSSAAFTLLEVVIAISILLVIVMGVSMMLRANFDIRFGLAEENKVTHRIAGGIQKIAYDTEHAFVFSPRDSIRNPNGNRNNVFKIEKKGDSDRFALTTMSHRPFVANDREADTSYVVYEVREAEDFQGRKHLYRGETKRIPEEFKDDPEMKVFVRHVKSLTVTPWNGEDWSNEGWDNTRREWRGKMPRMVKIEIIAWDDDPINEVDAKTDENAPTVTYSTVAFIPQAAGIEELKAQLGTIRWDKL